jgi:hypothetical protein
MAVATDTPALPTQEDLNTADEMLGIVIDRFCSLERDIRGVGNFEGDPSPTLEDNRPAVLIRGHRRGRHGGARPCRRGDPQPA